MFRRIRVHFSNRYIGKHHPFLLCKYDAGIKIKSLFEHESLVEVVTPAGRKPDCPRVFTRASILVREIAAAAAELIRLLHASGYSLDGCLKMSKLFWIPETKTLKIGGLRGGYLRKRTDVLAIRDYSSVFDIFTNEIFSDVTIPLELQDWLSLLTDQPLSDVDLICNHMFLLEDEEKVAKYIILYQQLQQVKAMNYDIYQTALSFVSTTGSTGKEKWKANVLQSFLLEAVKNHQPVGYYQANAEGLVTFGRHCCHHLLDGSVKITRHRGAEVVVLVIKMSEIYSHMEVFVPGLFAQVQKGMHRIKEELKAANLPMP